MYYTPHNNGTITPWELDLIINHFYPQAENILFIGEYDSICDLEFNLSKISNRKYCIDCYSWDWNLSEISHYKVVYISSLWYGPSIPWIKYLRKINAEYIVTTIFYDQIHIIQETDGRIINRAKTKIPGNVVPELMFKLDWMEYLSEYWECCYDSGIHQVWKNGKAEWRLKLSDMDYSVYMLKSTQYPYKPTARMVVHRKPAYVYHKTPNVIREYGRVVENIENWYDDALAIVNAYYKRELGPGRLELRNTREPVYIPGMICVPFKVKGNVIYRHISDPFI